VVEVTVGAEVVGEVHFLIHRARAGGAGGGGGAVREGRHGWRRGGGFRVFWEEPRACLLGFMESRFLKGVVWMNFSPRILSDCRAQVVVAKFGSSLAS